MTSIQPRRSEPAGGAALSTTAQSKDAQVDRDQPTERHFQAGRVELRVGVL